MSLRMRPIVKPCPPFGEVLEPRVLLAVFTVTTTADSGPGSLRQAILDANTVANADEIRFDIPGGGVHTIAPASPLPDLRGSITIDATTQPGYSGNPVIELDGSAAGAAADGLRQTTSASSTVRGLAINRFAANGISILAGTSRIEANYIGVDAAGEAARPNSGAGILVVGARATIGGTLAAQRNVISGNRGPGIRAVPRDGGGGPAWWTVTVLGNFVGTDGRAAEALGNGEEGVLLVGEPTAPFDSATIGGSAPGAGNVISGNGASGLRAIGVPGGTIAGNFIGTDAAGRSALGNGRSANAAARDGITITEIPNGFYWRIGFGSEDARNVVAGNAGAGISLAGQATASLQRSAQIWGNFVGTDSAGAADLGNGGDGVATSNVRASVIGNLISGNGGDGLHVEKSVDLAGDVEGNYIGTDASGTRAIGNDGDGVDLLDCQQIGVGHYFPLGSPPPQINLRGGGRNIISGNGGHGVRVSGQRARNVSVVNNVIGTNVAGTAPLGNQGSGVHVTGDIGLMIGGTVFGAPGIEIDNGNLICANKGDGVTVVGATGAQYSTPRITSNRIGTNAAGAAGLGNGGHGIAIVDASGVLVSAAADDRAFANTIAYNNGDGIRVTGATSQVNRISSNRLFSNAGLGIDLGGDGATPNDPLDADSGPNGLQNAPVVTAAATGRTSRMGTTVQFTLHANPNQQHAVEFFASPARDPSGYGEGAKYLGQTTVTTDAAGNAVARVTVARAEPGWWITATATTTSGTTGNTSEFSAAVRVAERTAVGRRGVYEDSPVAAPSSVAPLGRRATSLVDSSAPAGPSRRRAYELS
jgi:hypothetical protein